MSRIPSLSSLRAFEAAARHRSFTKAAEELFRTQSAISRHISSLEEWIGKPLFFRNRRAVTLTPEGEAYMRELVDAFSRIELATRRVKGSGQQNILNIHAYSTFAVRWLIPRLKGFQDRNPEIDVRLTASTQPFSFDHGEIHGAIRTTPGDWGSDVRMDKLFDYSIIPVASPSLIQGPWPLRRIEDLGRVTLLHSLPRSGDWAFWLNRVGAKDIDPARGMKFESSVMTYLAAEQGMGVAMAQDFLVESDLRKGVLQQVFPQSFKSDRTYYFLSSPRFSNRPELEIFRNWLLEEVRKPAQA